MMGLFSHANTRDANESEIIAAFEALQCSVERFDVPCDLIIGEDFEGKPRTHLVEVKSGPKAPFTDDQIKFRWKHKGRVHTVWDLASVCELVASWGGPSAIVGEDCR